VRELSDIKNKQIPHEVRLRIATAVRDYTEQARVSVKSNSLDYSVEAFNNTDLFRNPDKVGVTLFFPNKVNATHVMCRIFPLSIGETAFGRQLENMEKQLLRKVP